MAEDDRTPPTEETLEKVESISDRSPVLEGKEQWRITIQIPEVTANEFTKDGRKALDKFISDLCSTVIVDARQVATMRGGIDPPKIDVSDVAEGKGQALRRTRIVNEQHRWWLHFAQEFLAVIAGAVWGFILTKPTCTKGDVVWGIVTTVLFMASHLWEKESFHRS
jgi:hypothetical protein